MHLKFAIFLFFLLSSASALSSHPKLLLISFDGFRYDLLNHRLVPNLHKWATQSTWFTSGVKSQFVTHTAPNHMSIATGLYEEEHGIVANNFFDSETWKMFDYFNFTHKEGVLNASQAEFWYTADPIWLKNERLDRSRRSASFYWPNGESPFPYFPHRPKIAKPWTVVGDLESWMRDVDDIIDAFTREKEPVNFVAWYVGEPDYTLHGNGFFNGELEKTLKTLDELFLYFIKKFDDNNLGSEVNIILTADHGHAEIEDLKHVMCVKDYVSGSGFEMADHMIYPHNDEIGEQIYQNLSKAIKDNGFDVNIHWKQDIPERWHFKNSSRIGKIVFEPLIGSTVSFSCSRKEMEAQFGENGTSHFNSSTHGHDPDRPEMRALLVMRGPAFSENFAISDVPQNVDLYGLMCKVLQITPTENNGTMEVVKRALKENRQGITFDQMATTNAKMHLKFAIFLFFLLSAASALSRHPKLLLISFDGFRYDLLDPGLVPNIHKWATLSTWFPSGLKSQYVTYTAPNHMSIATGLYEEEHGIVGNYFFDPEMRKMFDYFNSTHKEGVVNASQADFWYKADPIWLTNERWESSRRSASFYWPNGESPFPYIPHRPKIAKPWTVVGDLKSWMRDADDVIDAFTREKEPVNFVAWYVAEPDHTLHGNGFHNGELEKTLKRLDELFLYFIKKFDDYNLGSEVNIILTADHGHAEIKDEKHVMCVKDYVNGVGFEMGDHMIYPHSDEIGEQIYQNLSKAIKDNGFDVNIHWKQDIPERWHYKNSSRIGKIVFEPLIGSSISFSCTRNQMEAQYGENGTSRFNSSTHGHDPDRPEMRAFLVMRGPAFSENFTISDIPQNVDLYGLMCKVLQITPTENNGTMEVVKRALKENRYTSNRLGITFDQMTDSLSFTIILIPTMCIVIVFFAYGCKNTVLKSDPNWGRADNAQGYRPLSNQTNGGFELNDDDDEENLLNPQERERRRENNDVERGGRRNHQAEGGALGHLNNGSVTMTSLLDEMSDDDDF